MAPRSETFFAWTFWGDSTFCIFPPCRKWHPPSDKEGFLFGNDIMKKPDRFAKYRRLEDWVASLWKSLRVECTQHLILLTTLILSQDLTTTAQQFFNPWRNVFLAKVRNYLVAYCHFKRTLQAYWSFVKHFCLSFTWL